MNRRKKASKGTVVIQVFKERLKLVWSYLGKRYYLYLGLPNSHINQTVAKQKALQIEGDMATSNFDPTLTKYKPEYQKKKENISVSKLFQSFMAEKAKEVTPKTMEKYQATLGYLQSYFGNEAASSININKGESFALYLQERQLSAVQRKRRLGELKACWIWAIEKELISAVNPWNELVKRIKVPPKQKSKPFIHEEINAIIQAFKKNLHYSCYADYVEFLFGTGCRTGEAVGLRWKHLSEDCSTVWFGEIITRGVLRPVKGNKARTISLTNKLQVMLLKRRSANFNPEDLVFTSPEGKPIHDGNFRSRAWKKILTPLGIDYRKPYTTRHTLISHALDMEINPVDVAQLTGHNVETLYENYAGVVNSRPRLPEL
ncbi:MAG: tyrosine-type recombinase/integrase [Waterburya sp.]